MKNNNSIDFRSFAGETAALPVRRGLVRKDRLEQRKSFPKAPAFPCISFFLNQILL
jgi:hypothetical protein